MGTKIVSGICFAYAEGRYPEALADLSAGGGKPAKVVWGMVEA